MVCHTSAKDNNTQKILIHKLIYIRKYMGYNIFQIVPDTHFKLKKIILINRNWQY